MKKLLFIITFGMFLPMLIPLHARDFTYTYEGQTITYTVLDEEAKTCSTKAGLDNVMYPGNTVSGDLVLPANPKDGDIEYTLTEIGERSFRHCYELFSISIPSSVKKIEKLAFEACIGLTKAEFASIEHLCNIQFSGNYIEVCQSNPLVHAKKLYINGEEITSLIIPNSITEIGDFAFYGSSVISVTIPSSVKKIGACAFARCFNLKEAEFASIEHLCNIQFVDGITNPLYQGARLYINGREITDLVIPNSVTNIGRWAFFGSTNLSSVSIPNSVQSIGNDAFYGCTGLTSIYYNTQNPITCDNSIFSTYTPTLYVPKGAVDTFKATTPWNKFNKIEEYDFGGVTDAIADKAGEIDYTLPYEIYNFNGVKVGDNKDTLAPGLYIIRQGTTTKKISVQ